MDHSTPSYASYRGVAQLQVHAPCVAAASACRAMALHGAHARRNPTEALPPALVRDILLRLPADQRARAACVSRSWRTAMADPALWLRLDLSFASGVTCRVDGAALRAAAARARGGLVTLNVSDRTILWAATRAVVAENDASLRQVRLPGVGNLTTLAQLEALLAAAPALQMLEADVRCGFAAARRLLRNEPPYVPLLLRCLVVSLDVERSDFLALAADLRAHPSLIVLHIHSNDQLLLREVDALVDAALALRLTSLQLYTARLPPGIGPALARLLSSTALTRLHLYNMEDDVDVAFLDVPGAALVSSALRANCTLRDLSLRDVGLWEDVKAAVTLLGALTGHASLRSLDLVFNRVRVVAVAPAIGVALGTLVAADAPALEDLNLSWCRLGDAGLGPLCDALPRNSHLQGLEAVVNDMSDAFAAQRLLPAVRANTSLRNLAVDKGEGEENAPAAEEAMQLVKARKAAHAAAAAAAVAGGA